MYKYHPQIVLPQKLSYRRKLPPKLPLRKNQYFIQSILSIEIRMPNIIRLFGYSSTKFCQETNNSSTFSLIIPKENSESIQ